MINLPIQNYADQYHLNRILRAIIENVYKAAHKSTKMTLLLREDILWRRRATFHRSISSPTSTFSIKCSFMFRPCDKITVTHLTVANSAGDRGKMVMSTHSENVIIMS